MTRDDYEYALAMMLDKIAEAEDRSAANTQPSSPQPHDLFSPTIWIPRGRKITGRHARAYHPFTCLSCRQRVDCTDWFYANDSVHECRGTATQPPLMVRACDHPVKPGKRLLYLRVPHRTGIEWVHLAETDRPADGAGGALETVIEVGQSVSGAIAVCEEVVAMPDMGLKDRESWSPISSTGSFQNGDIVRRCIHDELDGDIRDLLSNIEERSEGGDGDALTRQITEMLSPGFIPTTQDAESGESKPLPSCRLPLLLMPKIGVSFDDGKNLEPAIYVPVQRQGSMLLPHERPVLCGVYWD